ncbi:amphi-Trp domain-containing protein [Haloferax namakaokahaiae]|uniref:Amphi-Trp domain-containing protein n=1 Tax=Haloferax namakaokahaiae TaxID=1748331 RepID=A0ABD5Z9P7_9EURY
MPEETVFSTELKEDRTAVAAYLRDVADKLETGELTLRAGSQESTLSVPARVTFEVKVEHETDATGAIKERSVEFELEWKDGQTDDATGLEIE